MKFLILKSLYDGLIINVASYISFKILVKKNFSWTFFFILGPNILLRRLKFKDKVWLQIKL